MSPTDRGAFRKQIFEDQPFDFFEGQPGLLQGLDGERAELVQAFAFTPQ